MTQAPDTDLIAATAVTFGAAQVQSELKAALDLVVPLKPNVIAEIGCYKGGSLYAWRQVCSRVYGITLLENYKYDGGHVQSLQPYGAVVYQGDSHDGDSRKWLTSQLNGASIDVLVIDGDHRFEAVKQDFLMYAPLVRPGGIVLLHDIFLQFPAFPDQEFQVWNFWEHLERYYTTSTIGTSVGWGVVHVQQGDNLALVAAASMTDLSANGIVTL